LPTAPTDLVPVPKAKHETTVQNLPQPYTPDAPRNNQPQSPPQTPPQTPKDILPPIIGATTTVVGKAAADVANSVISLSAH